MNNSKNGANKVQILKLISLCKNGVAFVNYFLYFIDESLRIELTNQ